MRDELRADVVKHPGDDAAVLMVDETGFLKEETHWERMNAVDSARYRYGISIEV